MQPAAVDPPAPLTPIAEPPEPAIAQKAAELYWLIDAAHESDDHHLATTPIENETLRQTLDPAHAQITDAAFTEPTAQDGLAWALALDNGSTPETNEADEVVCADPSLHPDRVGEAAVSPRLR